MTLEQRAHSRVLFSLTRSHTHTYTHPRTHYIYLSIWCLCTSKDRKFHWKSRQIHSPPIEECPCTSRSTFFCKRNSSFLKMVEIMIVPSPSIPWEQEHLPILIRYNSNLTLFQFSQGENQEDCVVRSYVCMLKGSYWSTWPSNMPKNLLPSNRPLLRVAIWLYCQTLDGPIYFLFQTKQRQDFLGRAPQEGENGLKYILNGLFGNALISARMMWGHQDRKRPVLRQMRSLS